MKAIVRLKPGKNFCTMRVQNVEPMPLSKTMVRIKMVSSRINPVDADLMKGIPFLKYKNPQIGGIDGAGEIIDVGADVKDYHLGDQVFFYRKFNDIGTWAEEITIETKYIAKIPSNLETQDAGAIALPLLTAYDSLTKLGVKAGQTILIHGAGGAVGMQAVQLANKLGLTVFTTANAADAKLLQSLGVSQIVNYKNQAFEILFKKSRPDYIMDVVGKDVLTKSISLKPKKVVSLSYSNTGDLHKTGLKMPSPMKLLMKLHSRKFRRHAKKNNVELIGQVTSADGEVLQRASDMVTNIDYKVKGYQTLTFDDIEKNGLGKADIGKVIMFNC